MEYSYHDKFLLYLESTYKFNEEGRKKLIEFAEKKLPAFLHSIGYPDFGDIYSNLNHNFWNGIVTNGLPASTDDEREYAHMVMESIKYIKGFIKFDKTVDYKKKFADKIKREKQKADKKSKSGKATHADNSQPEEEDQPRKEGAVTQVSVTHYERNPDDRKKALERYGYECQVCHMNFVDTYGEKIGKEYIEVHHLYPVCNMGENYQFDPLDPEKGLVCLCSNCHSMIHRGGHYEMIDGERKMVPMTLKELQDVYNERNKTE